MDNIALVFNIEASLRAINKGIEESIQYSEEWYYLSGKRAAYQDTLKTLERIEEMKKEALGETYER